MCRLIQAFSNYIQFKAHFSMTAHYINSFNGVLMAFLPSKMYNVGQDNNLMAIESPIV